jgi:MFS family permease
MVSNLRKPAVRITATLFAGQSLVSAAIIAVSTVLAIVATQISGDPSRAGLPTAITNLAAAPGAFGLGLLWDRIGRRKGLAFGLAFGIIGTGVALFAIQSRSFPLLLTGMVGVGFARSGMQLGRFIAAEVNPPDRRGRAISYVVFGGTIGAVGGPLLVSPSSQWALALGLDELAGPFLVSVFLFLLVTIVSLIGLNPEPLALSKQIAEEYPEAKKASNGARPIRDLLRQPSVIVAMTAMVVSQMVMVMVMGITSLYMRDHAHELSAISIVFSSHTLGMFAFSVFTGRLADKWGRGPVILVGVGLLLASFVIAPMYPTTALLAMALFLLGLGWNFCFVGGSALLADQLTPAERAGTQGFNDLLIGLASAGGSFWSGIIYAGRGYGTLNLISGLFALIILAITLWWFFSYLPRQPKAETVVE